MAVKKNVKAEPKVKKTVKKVTPRTEKVESKVAAPIVKPASKKETAAQATVKIDVLGLDGKVAGSVNLSGQIFAAKINPVLMTQAVRVYLANQRQGNASTKTRGEIAMTTA